MRNSNSALKVEEDNSYNLRKKGSIDQKIGFEEISKLEDILFRADIDVNDLDRLYDFFELGYFEEKNDLEDFVDLKGHIDKIYANELKGKIEFLSTALAYMISSDGKRFTRK